MNTGADPVKLSNHAANCEGTLATAVRKAIDNYLFALGGHEPINLYQLALAEVERPLLEAILHHTHGNQSRAANCLGISRGTLRKKLKTHGLD